MFGPRRLPTGVAPSMTRARRVGARIFLATCLATLLPRAVAGAEALRLPAVVLAALDHGQKAAHADIRLKLAEARLREAQGAFDWRATARAGWTRIYYPKSETVGGFRVLTDRLDSSSAVQVSGGVSRLFRNGIQVQPGFSYFPSVSAPSGQTLGQTRPMPFLNLQVPLLHAFDEDNPAAAAERAAASDVIGTTFERTAARQQGVLESVQLYWRCLATQEVLGILTSAQASSNGYLKSLRSLLGAGQIETAAVDRATAKGAKRDADLAKSRESLASCNADLASLVGKDRFAALPSLDQEFTGAFDIDGKTDKLSDSAMVETAMNNRPDIKAAEQYVEAANARLAAARAGLDPKVDLTLNPDGAFVTISKSIEANAEEGAASEAEANLSEAQLNLAELRDQVGRDVSSALLALRDSLGTLRALRRSDLALKQVIRDARNASRNGGMGVEEERILEDELSDLDIQLVQASLDCALNLASLRLATGTVNSDGGQPDGGAGQFRSLQF